MSPTISQPTADVALARQQVRAAGRSYAGRRALAVLLPAAAAGLLLGLLGRHWPAARWELAGAAGLGLLLIGWRLGSLRQVRAAQVAGRLDRQFPALEDSTGLLWRAANDLNLLEQIQQRRVAQRLQALRHAGQLRLPVSFRNSLCLTCTLLLASAAAWWAAPPGPASPRAVAVHFAGRTPAAAGTAPPRISETRLLVTPPAYTGRAAFAPAQASFQCPENSRVRWQVRASGPARWRPVLETGRQRHAMQPVAGQPGTFVAELTLRASTLYRLRFAGTVSDDYAIDVRADQAPVLRIQTPKPYTLVPAVGQVPEVAVRASVRDDYGLRQAEMVITVAQGQGEAVKFRELRRDLSPGLSGAQGSLRSVLSLPKLGLSYGDELYFYLTARDNAGHTARTDSYLVQWQDTAVADSAPDLGMGVKVAPAYFRSERQIIIDTEKLVAEKPKLDAATVASRANALGFDQQTLRLRYGKFLGEESEAGIGAPAPRAPVAEDEDAPAAPTADAPEHDEHGHDDHDHAAPPVSPAKASPTAETDALMDPYIHKHDDAETADFLEPAIKTKLHAVLDQMWAAELRLRTGQLKAALPYAYRALRLLKEVQQQTRVFVKKAGFTPPPLPEATVRLTGELAGAAVLHRQQQTTAPVTQPAVRAALQWLSGPGPGLRSSSTGARALEQAGAVLAAAALERPGVYLPALKALRQLVADAQAGRPACAACRPIVERALTDLLPAPAPAPASAPGPGRLGRRYFQELSR